MDYSQLAATALANQELIATKSEAEAPFPQSHFLMFFKSLVVQINFALSSLAKQLLSMSLK